RQPAAACMRWPTRGAKHWNTPARDGSKAPCKSTFAQRATSLRTAFAALKKSQRLSLHFAEPLAEGVFLPGKQQRMRKRPCESGYNRHSSAIIGRVALNADTRRALPQCPQHTDFDHGHES
ncbi:hypothetical protein, partial [Achromobacter ruhlandii]